MMPGTDSNSFCVQNGSYIMWVNIFNIKCNKTSTLSRIKRTINGHTFNC